MGKSDGLAVVWALLLAFSLLGHGRAVDAQEMANLIRNAGFEEGKGGWRLVGAELDATVAHEGKHAVKVTGTGDGYQGVLHNPPGQFRVEAACKYEISLWARLQKHGGWFKARVRQRKGAEAAGKEYGFLLSDSADWKEWSFEFVTALEADNIDRKSVV